MSGCCCSGEEGFAFFFAGELEGELSVLAGLGSLSVRRLGLLISFIISLRLVRSSWERSGGSVGEVSIGTVESVCGGLTRVRSSSSVGGGNGGRVWLEVALGWVRCLAEFERVTGRLEADREEDDIAVVTVGIS